MKLYLFQLNPFIISGDGPRNCIGVRFGLLQTKLGIAELIKNFKFKLNKNTNYPLELDVRDVLINCVGKINLDAEKIL